MKTRPSGKQLIILLGGVSLWADFSYEGMRSAIGPYLELFGASAAAVGLVAGAGELLGYGLRYFTGDLADRTGRYWILTIVGYSVNLVAIPLLALAPSWPMVALLVAVERTGKAIRSPSKAAITSFASHEYGAGKSFAIAEAMDQLGALLGPLMVAAILAWRGSTIAGFAWAFVALAIPALLCLGTLLVARRRFPDPRALAPHEPVVAASASQAAMKLSVARGFRIYLIGVALVGLGLADWPMVAFHLQRHHVIATSLLPVVYAVAMAIDGVVGIVIGLRFDAVRKRGGSGAGVLAWCIAAAALFAPLIFLAPLDGQRWTMLMIPGAGIALWSLGRAATESIAKSTVAVMVPAADRGRAYGIFYLVFGVAWWVGSTVFGLLYDRSVLSATVFASAALAVGAVVLAMSARMIRVTTTR